MAERMGAALSATTKVFAAEDDDRAHDEHVQRQLDDADPVLAIDELMRKVRARNRPSSDLRNAENAAGELRFWFARLK